jgi:hypothetical protein
MKFNTYFLAGMLLVLFFSCEKSETSIVETEANLKIDIAVTTEMVDNSKSGNYVSEFEYPFSGESTYSVNKITKNESGLYNIQKIKPHHEPFLTIHGVTNDVEIHSISLEWGYKPSNDENYMMQEPIDISSFENERENDIYKIKLDKALIQLISSISDTENTTIKVKISGKSDFNINSNAYLEIPVIVEATTLSPRFELF